MWLLRLVSLLLDSLYECNITLKYMFLTYYSQNLALWGLFLLCQFFPELSIYLGMNSTITGLL